MANRVVEYVFRGNFSNLTAGLTAATRSVSDYSGRLNALDAQGRQMRASLSGVADTAGKMGIVAAAGVGAVIASAANFDQAMSNVQAATHETAANMDLLRQAALDAGQSTVYSATESASAIEELSKAGVSTSDILAGGLAGSLNLAAAGAIDVGEAAETAASAMTQFGLQGDQVNHIADLLAAGAGKAQGSVHDLGMALNQSGLVASQTGLSIEEATGGLAAFASAGLVGSDAGTSFKTMLQALTPSSKQAAELMDELGIKAYDQQGAFIGLANYAGVLQEKLSGMSAEQRNATLKTIFGSDAVRAASVLYQQGANGIQSWIDKTNDSGYAAETASTRLDNLKGDWEQLTGALETALITTGEGSQGPLRETVQAVTALINAYNDLPGPIKNTALAAGALAAVFGGGLWFTAKTINGIANMRANLSTLGVSANATSRAMKGLGVAAGVAVGVDALFISIDALNKALDQDLPGVNALEGRLISLADGTVTNLGSEFDNLGGSISRVADGRWDDGLESFFNHLLPGDQTAKSLREASAQIDVIDQALTQMVTEGHADVAAKALDSLGLSGKQLADLKPLLTGYNEALAGTQNQSTLTADSTDALGDAASGAADSVTDLTKAMTDQRSAALDAFDAVTQYGNALDAAQKAAAKGKRGIDSNTEAGRENRAALSDLAAAWNNQSDAVRNNSKKFQAARSDFIKTAEAMGVPQAAARKLARQLLEIPDSKVTTVTVDTGSAATAVRNFQQMWNNLHSKNIVLGVSTPRSMQATLKATGGYISGPGTATSDSIPARLSNGEYVMRASAVARYGTHMMDALNAERFASGGPVGYAKGGSVMYAGVSVGGLTVEKALKKLENAAEKASDALDDTKSAAESLSSGITSSLKTDAWDTSSSGGAFSRSSMAGSVTAAIASLQADVANSKEYQALEASLKGKVTGGAYTDAIGSGNLDELRALAGATPAQQAQYSALYASREKYATAAGSYASSAVYGKTETAQLSELKQLNAGVKALQVLEKAHHKLTKAAPAKQAAATARALDKVARNSKKTGGKKAGSKK